MHHLVIKIKIPYSRKNIDICIATLNYNTPSPVIVGIFTAKTLSMPLLKMWQLIFSHPALKSQKVFENPFENYVCYIKIQPLYKKIISYCVLTNVNDKPNIATFYNEVSSLHY